jgi:predicted PurR-regulated permease PerM
LIPQAVRQAHDLARDFPGYLDRLRTSTGTLGTLEAKYHLSERLQQASSRVPDLAIGKIPSITAGAGSVIVNTLTIVVLTTYFLLGLERGHSAAQTIVAGEHADRNIRILDESLERIGGYVSGNIFVSIIAGTLAFIMLEILGAVRGRPRCLGGDRRPYPRGRGDARRGRLCDRRAVLFGRRWHRGRGLFHRVSAS